MSHPSLIRLALVLVLALEASSAGAAPEPQAEAPRTGSFQLKVAERSKTSAIPNVIARMGWGQIEQVKAEAQKKSVDYDYNLSNETFEAFVPEDYTGEEPYGLIVWVSPGPNGHPQQQWLDVIRRHKLIWIGANNSGNNRLGWVRLGLAIDAAVHMQKAYKIDPLRVYVSGASGGGRCASMLAMGFPDVFTGGGYPIIGCNYFKLVELGPGEDGRMVYYKRDFERPSGKLFRLATKERRFVLLTGDTDPNRPQTNDYFNAMKKDGFQYVTYLQVPGMGHQSPDAEWFEKGIVALDEARDAVAKLQRPAEEKKAPVAAAASAKQPQSVAPAARETASEPSKDEEADKLMRVAKLYVSNRLYNRARDKLNQIVKEYPTSAPAAEARKLLKEIGNK